LIYNENTPHLDIRLFKSQDYHDENIVWIPWHKYGIQMNKNGDVDYPYTFDAIIIWTSMAKRLFNKYVSDDVDCSVEISMWEFIKDLGGSIRVADIALHDEIFGQGNKSIMTQNMVEYISYYSQTLSLGRYKLDPTLFLILIMHILCLFIPNYFLIWVCVGILYGWLRDALMSIK